MQYVTSFERFEIAKVRQEGFQKGESEMLGLLLKHRFGDLPDTVANRLKYAREDQLKEWLIKAISASTLDAVLDDMT